MEGCPRYRPRGLRFLWAGLNIPILFEDNIKDEEGTTVGSLIIGSCLLQSKRRYNDYKLLLRCGVRGIYGKFAHY